MSTIINITIDAKVINMKNIIIASTLLIAAALTGCNTHQPTYVPSDKLAMNVMHQAYDYAMDTCEEHGATSDVCKKAQADFRATQKNAARYQSNLESTSNGATVLKLWK